MNEAGEGAAISATNSRALRFPPSNSTVTAIHFLQCFVQQMMCGVLGDHNHEKQARGHWKSLHMYDLSTYVGKAYLYLPQGHYIQAV